MTLILAGGAFRKDATDADDTHIWIVAEPHQQEAASSCHADEAKQLAEALVGALPSGTLDRLPLAIIRELKRVAPRLGFPRTESVAIIRELAPPISYMGSKRAYASAILSALGQGEVEPGGAWDADPGAVTDPMVPAVDPDMADAGEGWWDDAYPEHPPGSEPTIDHGSDFSDEEILNRGKW